MKFIHFTARRPIYGNTLQIGFAPFIRGTSEDVNLNISLQSVVDNDAIMIFIFSDKHYRFGVGLRSASGTTWF